MLLLVRHMLLSQLYCREMHTNIEHRCISNTCMNAIVGRRCQNVIKTSLINIEKQPCGQNIKKGERQRMKKHRKLKEQKKHTDLSRCELKCTGRIGNSCSTYGTLRGIQCSSESSVNVVNEITKKGEVRKEITTAKTYSESSVRQAPRSDETIHEDALKTSEVNWYDSLYKM